MIILDEAESNHCINVLRYKIGDSIKVVDGKGSLYKGIIQEYIKKECIINIVDVFNDYKKRNFHVHIAIAPTKNHERLEWFVEKAIEIGVSCSTNRMYNVTQPKIIIEIRLSKRE